MGARGGDESAFKHPSSWEGPVGTAKVANRTREIRPCGMIRGACGNVDQGGTRNPPCISKEQVLETLHLKLCAPQFYPDCSTVTCCSLSRHVRDTIHGYGADSD